MAYITTDTDRPTIKVAKTLHTPIDPTRRIPAIGLEKIEWLQSQFTVDTDGKYDPPI